MHENPGMKEFVSDQSALAGLQFLDIMSDAALAIDCHGCVIAWNRAMESISGVMAQDILGKADYEYALPFYGIRRPMLVDLIVHPEPEAERLYNSVTRQGDTLFSEIRVTHRSGGELVCRATAKPLYDSLGNIVGAVETIRDGTEYESMYTALREIEARYEALFDRSLECVYLHDLQGKFIDANQTTLDLLGYTREEVSSLNFVSMITADQLPLAVRVRDEIVENGHQHGTSTYQVLKRDGGLVYLETKGALIYKEGRPFAIQGVARDITERMNAEEALRESSLKYRNIFENVTDLLYIHDLDGNLLETNLASKKDIGYSAQDVIGMRITDLMPDQYKPIFAEYMDDLKKHKKQEGLISILTKEGRERVIEYRNILVEDSDGTPVCVQGSGRDITARIKGEKALKLSEERYRDILDSIEEAYFEVDLAGNFTFFNQALATNLGYSEAELKEMNYRQYMDETNAKKVFEMFHTVFLTGEPTKSFDWELMNKEGGKIYAEASVSLLRDSRGKPVGFRGIVRDITGRKEAEKERDRYEMRLSQAQKMEAIGTLAGGIAHDFNNMLSAIIGYTELVKNDVPEGSRGRKNLDQVLKAGMRARELVAQILSFSRKYEAERESVHVALILNEALKLLRVTIPTTIEIRDSLGEEDSVVYADPTEIHQIVMNLCTNAYQAMEETGGVLSVSLEPVAVGEPGGADFGNPDARKGSYLKLEVHDTGCGMTEETVKNIFDPFFTTKARGKGTGLGLATVHRIVTELGGFITVSSRPGEGTTFRIYFPRIAETLKAAADS